MLLLALLTAAAMVLLVGNYTPVAYSILAEAEDRESSLLTRYDTIELARVPVYGRARIWPSLMPSLR